MHVDPCTAGEMRVSEGTFKDGFLDYCFDGEWGIVCGDNWDSDNAEVACRQLGFKPSSKYVLRFSGCLLKFY